MKVENKVFPMMIKSLKSILIQSVRCSPMQGH